jgi:hypothetical protein
MLAIVINVVAGAVVVASTRTGHEHHFATVTIAALGAPLMRLRVAHFFLIWAIVRGAYCGGE